MCDCSSQESQASSSKPRSVRFSAERTHDPQPTLSDNSLEKSAQLLLMEPASSKIACKSDYDVIERDIDYFYDVVWDADAFNHISDPETRNDPNLFPPEGPPLYFRVGPGWDSEGNPIPYSTVHMGPASSQHRRSLSEAGEGGPRSTSEIRRSRTLHPPSSYRDLSPMDSLRRPAQSSPSNPDSSSDSPPDGNPRPKIKNSLHIQDSRKTGPNREDDQNNPLGRSGSNSQRQSLRCPKRW